MSDETKTSRRSRQIAWFIALWLAGVATLGVVAFAIRWVIASQFPGA